MARGNLAKAACLFSDALLRAMELDQEQRLFGQRGMRIGVEGAHRERVDELDASDRQARLDGLDRRLASRTDAWERAMPGRDRLGNAGEPQRDLDDDPKRPLGADEEMGQVVAGGGLLRPRSGAQE